MCDKKEIELLAKQERKRILTEKTKSLVIEYISNTEEPDFDEFLQNCASSYKYYKEKFDEITGGENE